MSRAADRELRAALPMRAGTAPIEDVATVFRFGGPQTTPLTPSSGARCCRHHLNWPCLKTLFAR